MLKDGQVCEKGTYKELISKGGHCAELVANYVDQQIEAADESEVDADREY